SLNDQEMNLFLKDVTPWVEDLSRYNRATNRVHLTHVFDIFLGRQGPLRCRFPWCKDVSVDQRFWESLVCLDLTKKGWIMDEDKSCVAEILNNFSSGCWEELNEEFNVLCETKYFVKEPAMIDLDSDDDLVKEVQRRDEKEKMLKYEEDKKKRRHEPMNSDHWKLSVSKISNRKRT
nr:phospholipase-like protein [Tanacetum cinerariifolium]